MGHSYRDLLVWRKSKELAIIAYRATERFPKSESFGLTGQIRRAAVSIASNIAEGQGWATKGEFHQFLGYARGSLLELTTQVEIASELGYIESAQSTALQKHASEVLALLNGLMASIRPKAHAAAADPAT